MIRHLRASSKLKKFMKYCQDPHAIYSMYDGCKLDDYKSLLYLLYQFFTDVQRMNHYLTLSIPSPIIHLIFQYLKTDAIYLSKYTNNIHLIPCLTSLEPLVQHVLQQQPIKSLHTTQINLEY